MVEDGIREEYLGEPVHNCTEECGEMMEDLAKALLTKSQYGFVLKGCVSLAEERGPGAGE